MRNSFADRSLVSTAKHTPLLRVEIRVRIPWDRPTNCVTTSSDLMICVHFLARSRFDSCVSPGVQIMVIQGERISREDSR